MSQDDGTDCVADLASGSHGGEEVVPAQSSPRLGRAFIQDPHALYRRLRAAAPAHRVVLSSGTHVWLVTRYGEARALLADPRLSKNWRELVELFPSSSHGPHKSLLNSHMLQQDPPDHTRLRKLVAKAFTARSVQKMRPDIVGIADTLLDRIAVAAGSGDADRRNEVLKLAQGEFVAVPNLESIYAAVPLVRQIFVYGNSERASLLAVIVPAPVAVAEYGNSPALKAALHQSLQQTAVAAQLQSYEVPVDFVIETAPFTDENGLLSGVGKLLRPRLKEHYGERLEQIYADIAAAQVDEMWVLR